MLTEFEVEMWMRKKGINPTPKAINEITSEIERIEFTALINAQYREDLKKLCNSTVGSTE